MQQVVQIIANSFSENFGDQIEAIYLYGSLGHPHFHPEQSDINLLIVVEDGTSIHEIRDLFLPIWETHHAALRRAPLVAGKTAFQRHLKLNPLLAHHLVDNAKLLAGSYDLTTELPLSDPRDAFAYLAYETMEASNVVAPDMLEPEVAETNSLKLQRIFRRVSGKTSSDEKSAVLLLAQIQHYLKEELDNSPYIEPWISPKRPTTSLLLPSLEGAYKEMGGLVMSFAHLTPHQIASTDWDQLSSQLAKHYTGLKIATSTQFRLILELQNPLAMTFQRYEHEWGVDVLNNVEISQGRIFRTAARVPSGIQIDSFPNAYLTSPDDQTGKLIHDFQNKLLNIQLEHELLARIQKIDRHTPPEPLPDRTAPPQERVDGIFYQLDWWADHYTNEMLKHA